MRQRATENASRNCKVFRQSKYHDCESLQDELRLLHERLGLKSSLPPAHAVVHPAVKLRRTITVTGILSYSLLHTICLAIFR